MKDFQGKTAFITGGASGAGFGQACVFGDAGCRIVIADIRRNAIDEALEKLKARRIDAYGVEIDITDRKDQYDVICTVKGGGLSGQAGAVKHGISQALTKYEPALRSTVKQAGFLTRDSRTVERKKYGTATARKSFQFSKRGCVSAPRSSDSVRCRNEKRGDRPPWIGPSGVSIGPAIAPIFISGRPIGAAALAQRGCTR